MTILKFGYWPLVLRAAQKLMLNVLYSASRLEVIQTAKLLTKHSLTYGAIQKTDTAPSSMIAGS